MIRFALSSAPASEPVTTAQAKAHAKIDISDDDTLVEGYIIAARQRIEAHLGRALITQEWTATLDKWPALLEGDNHRRVRLAYFPVQSIEAVSVDGVAVTASNYRLDGKDLLVSTSVDDSGGEIDDVGVVIEFTAGYGDAGSDVPAPILNALKMLVAHLYDARAATSPQGIYHQLIPEGLQALLQSYIVLEI